MICFVYFSLDYCDFMRGFCCTPPHKALCHNPIFDFFYFIKKQMSEMIKMKNELKFGLRAT